MLNKLHFDFRNAKATFLGVSYLKLDDQGIKPSVGPQKPEVRFGDSSSVKEVEHNGVEHAEANGAGDGEMLLRKTVCSFTGSAVQVDDGDSDRLPVVSAAATVHLHPSSDVTVHEPGHSFTLFTTEHNTQSGDTLLPCCSLPEKKTSPTIGAVSSLVQANQPTDFTHDREHASEPKRTENNIADNETAVALAVCTDEELLSLCAEKTYSLRERVKVVSCNTDHDTAELSDGCGQTESRVTSASSSVAALDDDLDYTPKRRRKRNRGGTPRARCVKKSVKTETPVKIASIKTEFSDTDCKLTKPRVMRAPRKRRNMKSDLEDDVWSSGKKLLLIPVNTKMSKSGKKRSNKTRKSISASTRKRKGCKSTCVEGIEMLPDLGVKLEPDNLTEVLKMSSWHSDLENNTSAENAPRKWYIDITGADLTTDMDIDYGRITKAADIDEQKYQVDDKVNDQNVGHVIYAADVDCHNPTIATSQETPPPSVVSDSLSSCDDLDQSVRLDPEEEEEFSDSRWLNFETRLACYIDGRRFDRLVNGISVKVPATLSDEALVQIGQESLRLSNLTKRDVKQLQDQVRLEEIYHRRAMKSILSVSVDSLNNRRGSRRSSRQLTVPGREHRSRSRSVTKSLSTVDTGNEDAQAFAVNQPGSSFSAYAELCPPAADLDNDAETSDGETAKSNNMISEPDGMRKSELLKGNVAGALQETSFVNTDDADQHESACVSVLVRIRRSIAAVKNKSRRSDLCCDLPSVGLTSSQSNVDSDAVAESQFLALDDAPSRQKLASNADSLHKRYSGLDHADDRHRTGTQCGALNTVAEEPDISYPGAAYAVDNEYIAAMALASLSVAAKNPLRSTYLEAHATVNQCQMEEENQSIQRGRPTDAEGITVLAHDSAHQRLTEMSSSSKADFSKTVAAISSVKPSGQDTRSSGHHLKGGTKAQHVSADGHNERTQKSAGNVTSENKKIFSESCRSHGKSHFTEASGHMKEVSVSDDKEKSSGAYLPKSSVDGDISSSHMAASSIVKKNREMSGTASDIATRNDIQASTDETRYRKHRSGSHCHSAENRESGRPEKKQVAGISLEGGNSGAASPTKIDSHSNSVIVGKSGVLSKSKDIGGRVTVSSTVSDAASNRISTSSSNCALVTTTSPQSSSQNMLHFDGTFNCSGTKANISLDLQEMPVNLTSSLPAENLHLMSGTEAGTAAIAHDASSRINSNNLSKQSSIFYGANSGTDVSVIMPGSGVLSSGVLNAAAVPNVEVLPDSCSSFRNNETSAGFEVVQNPLQLPTTLSDFSPESPTSPYRELEEIRSPSPNPTDAEKDERARDIRSPSPCDMESSAAVFRVVETSWDVRFSSPCEIQSPDVSEDEAEDTAAAFSGPCNVCFHHGPLTIPLIAEETTVKTHDHQLDMT